MYPYQMFTDEESVQFLQDKTVQDKLANAKKLSDINVGDYEAIFYPGGHGPVLDLPTDPVNIKLASEVWSSCLF
jgi:putative intracellular protease/amidase